MAGRHQRHYSVYENGTDRPICIHGTAAECAASLGIDIHTFYNYVARKRKNDPHAPEWIEIYFDEDDDTSDSEVNESTLNNFDKESI